MKQEKSIKALVVVSSFIFLVVCFSGCTSNQNINENENILTGTWAGAVQMPMFGRTGNVTVSKIAFSGNTTELTLTTQQGTFTTNYTYAINGATLVFTPRFNGRGGFPGGQQYNRTRLPGNWTGQPTNDTRSNETHPYNNSRLGNRTGYPGGGQPVMSVSFTYSVNEDQTILYLNGAEFRKVEVRSG